MRRRTFDETSTFVPPPVTGLLRGAHVALIGFPDAAREYARALRAHGNEVVIGVHLGDDDAVRASAQGLRPVPPELAIADADVVIVFVPDDDQASTFWGVVEPWIAAAAERDREDDPPLLVFHRATAIATGAFRPRGVDVVFVMGEDADRRVGVHANVTGGALDAALRVARTVFGIGTPVGATTAEIEATRELAERAAACGGGSNLVQAIDALASGARRSHAPEEARLRYYEALRELAEISRAHHAVTYRDVPDFPDATGRAGSGSTTGVPIFGARAREST
ncbi:MAG: hypothetical protein AB7S26_42530 [Sandaracinaceae bacterium]